VTPGGKVTVVPESRSKLSRIQRQVTKWPMAKPKNVPAIYLAIISERGAVPWSKAVEQKGIAAELGLPIHLEHELDDIREAQVGFGYERHASLTDIYAHSLIRLVASHAVADDPHRHRKSDSFASSGFGTGAGANLRSAGETRNAVVFIHSTKTNP